MIKIFLSLPCKIPKYAQRKHTQADLICEIIWWVGNKNRIVDKNCNILIGCGEKVNVWFP